MKARITKRAVDELRSKAKSEGRTLYLRDDVVHVKLVVAGRRARHCAKSGGRPQTRGAVPGMAGLSRPAGNPARGRSARRLSASAHALRTHEIGDRPFKVSCVPKDHLE